MNIQKAILFHHLVVLRMNLGLLLTWLLLEPEGQTSSRKAKSISELLENTQD